MTTRRRRPKKTEYPQPKGLSSRFQNLTIGDRGARPGTGYEWAPPESLTTAEKARWRADLMAELVTTHPPGSSERADMVWRARGQARHADELTGKRSRYSHWDDSRPERPGEFPPVANAR